MSFAGISSGDNIPASAGDKTGDDGQDGLATPGVAERETVKQNPEPVHSPPKSKGFQLMENERELTTGMLSKGASFRLIVSGAIGVKEIERLIAKLELDKEILAEPDEPNSIEQELFGDAEAAN